MCPSWHIHSFLYTANEPHPPPVWGHPVEKNRKKEVRKGKMMQNGIKWTLYTATPVRITSR